MMEKGVNCPQTSSCGRLFDAVSALLGGRLHIQYEGQAAMELESLARQAESYRNIDTLHSDKRNMLPVSIDFSEEVGIIRSDQMIETLLSLHHFGVAPTQLALEFHLWLAESVTSAIKEIGSRIGPMPVLLSGGCMQNSLLLDRLVCRLQQEGFNVFSGHRVPTNDGGIALGQAVIGGYRISVSGGEQ